MAMGLRTSKIVGSAKVGKAANVHIAIRRKRI
jgi:hypothetical protein